MYENDLFGWLFSLTMDSFVEDFDFNFIVFVVEMKRFETLVLGGA